MEAKNRTVFSQNFLRSKALVNKLIDMSSITADDLVYDIGAGKGIITGELAKRCRKVIAFEIDQTLYYWLRRTFENSRNIELRKENFLSTTLPKTPYKILSNIPFNITAQIIRKIASTRVPPVDSYLVVQKEAAKKFIGYPCRKGTQASLLLEPWFDLNIIYQFKPYDFTPHPSVSISFLHIKKREHVHIDKDRMPIYKDFIVYAFSRWKPTLVEGLEKIFTKKQFLRLSRDLGIDMGSTPSDLHYSQWLGLFRYFLRGVSSEKKAIIIGAEKRQKKQQKGLTKIHRTRLSKDWLSQTI